MARKVTLTVPDSLYVQIERWRSAFNLSQVFQEAIAEAIRRREEFQRRLAKNHNLNEIIQRLRREKESHEQRTRRAASDLGHNWASKAHYADLLAAVHTTDAEARGNPAIAQLITTAIDSLKDDHGNAYASPEDFEMAVISGWRQGVLDFWATVKDST